MEKLPHISTQSFVENLQHRRKPYHDAYVAMYSNQWGGIVTDPQLMLLPIDDHMVHRGDGVFETFKCVDGSIYNLAAHIRRLEQSASRLAISLPYAAGELEEIVIQTARLGRQRDCTIRLFVGRGPGSLGVNPYDSPESSLYVVVAKLSSTTHRSKPQMATARTSSIPLKHPFFASMKSCNYLPNVLMKKEATDHSVDYVIGFTESGLLAEAPTENIGIVTTDNELLVPAGDHILEGTTMVRVLTLAQELVERGELTCAAAHEISKKSVVDARELLAFGTTPDVASIVTFDNHQIGNGKPGPIGAKLGSLLQKDILENKALHTRVFE